MKLALVSDLHCHPWNEFADTQNKLRVNSRLLDCVSVVDEVESYCDAHRIKDIGFGGDLLHRPGMVPTLAYRMAAKALHGSNQTWWAVDGNHDHADRSGHTHALQALAYGGLCRIVHPEKGWRACELDTGAFLIMFSYCDDRDLLQRRLDESYKTIKGSRSVALFHHGFKGARVGTNLEYVVREEINAKTIISYGFDYIFSGHYHTHQKIWGIPNGHYIASPLEHVRGQREPGDIKGFLEYDFNAKTFKRIPIVRPRFVLVTQDDLDKGNLKHCKGNFVDVEWIDYAGGSKAVEEAVRSAGAKGIKATQIKPPRSAVKVRMKLPSTLDPNAVLRKYMDHKRKELQGMNPKKLLRLGRELMQQAEGEKQ